MRTISGLFDTREQGEQAVAALENAGIASSDVSLASPGDNEESVTGAATLVTATVDEEQADAAEAILGSAGSVDGVARRAERDGPSADGSEGSSPGGSHYRRSPRPADVASLAQPPLFEHLGQCFWTSLPVCVSLDQPMGEGVQKGKPSPPANIYGG